MIDELKTKAEAGAEIEAAAAAAPAIPGMRSTALALATPRGMTEAQASAVMAAFGPDALAEMAEGNGDDNVDINGANAALGQSFPRLVIEHCMSAETAQFRKGWLTDTMTMTQFESIDVVLLMRKRGRVLWPPRDTGVSVDNQPDCTSNDAMHRSGGASEEIPATQACLSCPNSQWRVGDRGERIPPACSETFVDLLFDTANEYPRVLTSKRGAVKHLQAMRDKLRFEALGQVRKLGLPPQFPWSLAVAFSLCGVAEKSRRGEVYFVPGIVPGSIRALSIEETQKNWAAFQALKPVFQSQDIEAQVVDAEDAEDGGGERGGAGASAGEETRYSGAPSSQPFTPGPGEQACEPELVGRGAVPAEGIRKFGNR